MAAASLSDAGVKLLIAEKSVENVQPSDSSQ